MLKTKNKENTFFKHKRRPSLLANNPFRHYVLPLLFLSLVPCLAIALTDAEAQKLYEENKAKSTAETAAAQKKAQEDAAALLSDPAALAAKNAEYAKKAAAEKSDPKYAENQEKNKAKIAAAKDKAEKKAKENAEINSKEKADKLAEHDATATQAKADIAAKKAAIAKETKAKKEAALAAKKAESDSKKSAALVAKRAATTKTRPPITPPPLVDGTRLKATINQYCVRVQTKWLPNTAPYMAPCQNEKIEETWDIEGGTIRSKYRSDQCIALETKQQAKTKPIFSAVMQVCDGNVNQQWESIGSQLHSKSTNTLCLAVVKAAGNMTKIAIQNCQKDAPYQQFFTYEPI